MIRSQVHQAEAAIDAYWAHRAEAEGFRIVAVLPNEATRGGFISRRQVEPA